MEGNDEIQTAHYIKGQVTLHIMYLVRQAVQKTTQSLQGNANK